jgi:hypothetical protein
VSPYQTAQLLCAVGILSAAMGVKAVWLVVRGVW